MGEVQFPRGSAGKGWTWRLDKIRLTFTAPALGANDAIVVGLQPESAQASEPGIHVEILDIRNSVGAVACALFEGPGEFPTEFLRFATNGQSPCYQGHLRFCTSHPARTPLL